LGITEVSVGYQRKLTVCFTSAYFGSKLHWLGMSPLNSKFAPTTIGLSDVTLTEMATLVTPSNPGPLVVGITQSTSRV
jgi:hypothetical protein